VEAAMNGIFVAQRYYIIAVPAAGTSISREVGEIPTG